jgi:hypothetical protein
VNWPVVELLWGVVSGIGNMVRFRGDAGLGMCEEGVREE